MTKIPSKFVSHAWLLKIKEHDYLTEDGIEYDQFSVDELILEKEMKQNPPSMRSYFNAAPDAAETKHCPAGNDGKGHDVPINRFHLNKYSKTGLHSHCAECRKLYAYNKYQQQRKQA